MQVVELTAPRLDALRSEGYEVLKPGPGEVLIRLRAASLNFLDIAVATGLYPISVLPLVPVTDGAGEIAEIGAGVADWKSGDRAIPHFLPLWQDGALTQAVLALSSACPKQCLPHAGLHSLAACHWRRFGLRALQFAKAHGARVIITSSDEKLSRAREMGTDLVLETGGTETSPRSVSAAARGGTVFVIGFLSGSVVKVEVVDICRSLRAACGGRNAFRQDCRQRRLGST